MLTGKLILLGFLAVLLRTTAGQQQCKCGGHYANGLSVAKCANDLCPADPDRSIKCATIYRAQAVLGYDCVPWPTVFGNCATFEDGSRVCVQDPCQAGGKERSSMMCLTEAASQKEQVFVAARLTRNGLDYGIEMGRRMVQLQLAKLKIPDQNIQQTGVDLSISNITISRVVIPKLSYQLLPSSTIHVFASGGEFKFCANYRAKVVLVTMSGRICAETDPGTGLDLDMAIATTVESKGNLKLKLGACSLKVFVDVDMTGAVGTVVGMLKGLVEKLIQSQAASQMCSITGKTLDTVVNQMLSKLPEKVTVANMFDVSHAFSAMIVDEFGVQVNVGANITLIDKPETRVFRHETVDESLLAD